MKLIHVLGFLLTFGALNAYADELPCLVAKPKVVHHRKAVPVPLMTDLAPPAIVAPVCEPVPDEEIEEIHLNLLRYYVMVGDDATPVDVGVTEFASGYDMGGGVGGCAACEHKTPAQHTSPLPPPWLSIVGRNPSEGRTGPPPYLTHVAPGGCIPWHAENHFNKKQAAGTLAAFWMCLPGTGWLQRLIYRARKRHYSEMRRRGYRFAWDLLVKGYTSVPELKARFCGELEFQKGILDACAQWRS